MTFGYDVGVNPRFPNGIGIVVLVASNLDCRDRGMFQYHVPDFLRVHFVSVEIHNRLCLTVEMQISIFGEWLRTGDLGALDEDGYLHFHGMTKPVVNLNGNEVDP